VSIRGSKTPLIRVHSWFKNAPSFVSIRGSKPARKEKPSKLIASKVHLCSKVSQALAVSPARFSGEPPVSLNLPSLSQGNSRVSGSQAETTFALTGNYTQPLCQRQKSEAIFRQTPELRTQHQSQQCFAI